jgi:hypothetical protein
MAGWFDFVNGQTLPASRVQDYLMDQSVMVFADAAARSAALPSPTNGMVTYLSSTGNLEVCKQTIWYPIIETTNLAARSAVLPTRRNAVINGGFDFWQRSTSFALNPGAFGYFSADRWRHYNGAGGSTCTLSRQTFTPGTAPVAGYEAEFFHRIAVSGWTSGNIEVETRIEDVRTFAGQTVTLSFFAKASSAMTLTGLIRQNFGSGGSGSIDTGTTAFSISTSWARYTVTINLPSIAGKTVGAGSFLNPFFYFGANTSLDIWGVQLEAGSVATPFARAATTLQGELAACQRYYTRFTADNGVSFGGHGGCVTATIGQSNFPLPVTMRINPTSIDFANVSWYNYGNGVLYNSGTFVLQAGQTNYPLIRYTHGSSIFTAGQSGVFVSNATGGFIGFNAEL